VVFDHHRKTRYGAIPGPRPTADIAGNLHHLRGVRDDFCNAPPRFDAAHLDPRLRFFGFARPLISLSPPAFP
jgi:hypothetical protein